MTADDQAMKRGDKITLGPKLEKRLGFKKGTVLTVTSVRSPRRRKSQNVSCERLAAMRAQRAT